MIRGWGGIMFLVNGHEGDWPKKMKYIWLNLETFLPILLFTKLNIPPFKTWWLFYKRPELFTFYEHLGSPPFFGGRGVRVAHCFFSFLCCVVFLWFVSLSNVSYAFKVASVSGFVHSWFILLFSLTWIYLLYSKFLQR